MKKLKRAAVIVLFCVIQCAGGRTIQSAPASPILGILQSELQRNMQVLKQQAVPAYFGAYTVYDERTTQIVASFGAIERSDENHQRFATVEVRVGDYTLDNTHPMRGDARAMGPRLAQVSLPLTDDEKPIRLAMWRATDRTYKTATEALTRVKTNVAAKVKDEDPAPDFSREEAQTYSGHPVNYTLDQKAWESRLRRVSALFTDDPLIFSSDVSLTVEADNRYYTNSEGSQICEGDVGCRVFIQAVTKAPDGMELPLYSSYFATSPDGLPDEKQLTADARSMIELLGRLRKGAARRSVFRVRRFCPGRAAGVFFHEIFGHRVEGNRQRNVDDAQTFSGKIGQPVLPPFLSVVFDPDAEEGRQHRVDGALRLRRPGRERPAHDGRRQGRAENVPAGPGAAERRLPRRSNGHGRAEPGYAPVSRQSNLVVESSKSVSSDELMNMLREEARKQGKPFGLFFDNIEGGFTNTGRGSANAFNVLPNVVYRIYTDGRAPELVRGVDLIGTPLAAFAKIVATGDKTDVFNGVCGAESGGVPVSASSPPLLVSEVEVQKKAQSQETAPILPAPKPRRKNHGASPLPFARRLRWSWRALWRYHRRRA